MPVPRCVQESIPLNGASIQNEAEANMVLCVYRELVHRCGGAVGAVAAQWRVAWGRALPAARCSLCARAQP